MYLLKKAAPHKSSQHQIKNSEQIKKYHKTKGTFMDGPNYMNCYLNQLERNGKLAYISENDSPPIQKQPDRNIIQFTKIVTSDDGIQQTKSIFSTAPDIVLGDTTNGEYRAILTKVTLWTGHVMLALEWHIGDIVEHLIYKEGDPKASIERKVLGPDKFSLDRFAKISSDESKPKTFEHKILTVEQKDLAIALLNAELSKEYDYALGAGPEDEPLYDCVSWANKIWNQFP